MMMIYTVSFVILFFWSRFVAHFVYVRIAGALFFMALFPASTRSALPSIQKSSWPGISGESLFSAFPSIRWGKLV